MATYYNPSGKITFSSLVYLIILSVLIIPIFSYLYAYAIREIPLIYFNALATALFSGILLGISTIVISAGKVRNIKISIIYTIFIVTVAYILHWSVWLHFFAERNGISLPILIDSDVYLSWYVNKFSLIFYPEEFFNSIIIIVENGAWSFKGGDRISGVVYLGILAIEAGLLYFISLKELKNESGDPFCEISNKWMEKKVFPNYELVANYNTILSKMLIGDYSFKGNLIENNVKKTSYSIITIFYSDYDCYFKLENFKAYKDTSDSIDFKKHSLIDNIKIEGEYIDVFRNSFLREEFRNLDKNKSFKTNDNITNTPDTHKELNDLKVEKDGIEDELRRVREEKEPLKKSFNSVSDRPSIDKKTNVKKRIKSYLFLSSIIISVTLLTINHFYKQEEKQDFSNNIIELLNAEDGRQLDSIEFFFADKIDRYWDKKNIGYKELEKQYLDTWKVIKKSKNTVLDIKKIDEHTYLLNNKFEYFYKKKTKKKTVDSSVMVVFNDDGKIIEIYGID